MPKGIPRDRSAEHAILHRLKIARGHLDKVIDMTADGRYCIDIIHQSLAVQSALREVDKVILKHHMETCVADAMKNGRKDKIIDEVMKIMERK